MEYLTKELSLLELNLRVVFVWLLWKITNFIKKIGKRIKNPSKIFKIIQTWLEIKGINSLCLLHENQEQRDAWKKEWHLQLDVLKGQLSELKGR